MKWRRACRPWREVLDLLAPQLLLQLLMCGQYWRVAKDVKLVCDFSQTKSKETKTWHLDVFSDVLFQPFKMIGEAMFYPAMTKSWGSFPGVSFSGTNFQQLASVPERCETAQLLEALDSQAGNLWAIDEGDSKNSIAGFAAIDPWFFFFKCFLLDWETHGISNLHKLYTFVIKKYFVAQPTTWWGCQRGVCSSRFTVRMVGPHGVYRLWSPLAAWVVTRNRCAEGRERLCDPAG